MCKLLKLDYGKSVDFLTYNFIKVIEEKSLMGGGGRSRP